MGGEGRRKGFGECPASTDDAGKARGCFWVSPFDVRGEGDIVGSRECEDDVFDEQIDAMSKVDKGRVVGDVRKIGEDAEGTRSGNECLQDNVSCQIVE